MTNENRTIQILAVVKDLASAALARVGRVISETFGNARRLINGFVGEFTPLQGAISGLLAALSVGKGVQVFNDIADGLAKVARGAQEIGGTASSLYLLRNAAAASGVPFEQLNASLVVFQKNIGAARQGGQEQQVALRQLGLTTDQFTGSQRDLVDQMAVVADALGNVTDESARTSLATKLFGDAGAKLLPLLRQGGQALRDYAKAQQAAGLAITDRQLQDVLQYQRSLATLENTLRSLAEQVVVNFAPVLIRALQDVREAILRNAPQIRETLGALFEVLVEGLDILLSVAGLVTQVVQGWRLIAESAKVAYYYASNDSEGVKSAQQALVDITRQADAADKGFTKLSDSLQAVAKQAKTLKSTSATVIVEAPKTEPPSPEVQGSFDRFWDGFKAGAQQAKQALLDWRNTGMQAARTLIDSGVNNVANAVAQAATGVQSWAAAFRIAATSIVQDLIRVITKMLIVKALERTIFSSSDTPTTTSGPGAGGGGLQATLDSGAGSFSSTLTGAGGAGGGSLAATLDRGGSAVTVNYNISAMDGADVQRVLLRNRGTLRAIAQQDMARNRSVRQSVRGAAR